MLSIKNGKFEKAGKVLNKHFTEKMDGRVSSLIKTYFSLSNILWLFYLGNSIHIDCHFDIIYSVKISSYKNAV